MNAPIPTPPKPKRYEFKATDCAVHEGRCAMRRERGVGGPFECVFCANAAAIAEVLAPVASPVPEQQKPPATTSHAVEASQPVDTTERGAGVACPPLDVLRDVVVADEAALTEAIRAFEAVPPGTVSKPMWTGGRDPWDRARTTPALDAAALHDVARAAREASLALDTLTQRIKHALESAPPPVAAAAQLSTPKPPADAPVPESAAESQADGGGADADLPPGWTADGGGDDGTIWYGDYCAWVAPSRNSGYDGEWFTRGPRYAPTMLQAMCAALGILFERGDVDGWKWSASFGGDWLCSSNVSKEDCAKYTLEAFHARQQAPEREQRLRAAGFEPVDQRAYTVGDAIGLRRATHPDGSPRAGCDVCSAQGAPELGPRERGMR